MAHVDEALRELADELRPTYPAIPPCVTAGDEPRGDFTLATYTGFRPCATYTFDEGVVPVRKTMAHELWHAAHELGAGRLSPDAEGRLTGAAYVLRYDDPVLLAFHAAMRYAATLTTIIDDARWWGEYVSEQMAEAFGYLVAGYRVTRANPGIWWRWGAYLNDVIDDGSLAAFFRSVRPKGEADMDEATIRAIVRDELERAGVRATDEAIKAAFWKHAHDVPTVQLGDGDIAPAGETATPVGILSLSSRPTLVRRIGSRRSYSRSSRPSRWL